ncbi:hypothetical protein N7510_000533 [Penicillium lagena]|uniref:uncharacterized protein n=1 Tax=Penicillium lagena TaxID=94218 RepID=UPI00253F88FC|nr:uncharacterized protein N7510_000533 [Penicillium lagena]KAJ5624224.1 hypothetical protein N7510_000533 [Penicillium lagena]
MECANQLSFATWRLRLFQQLAAPHRHHIRTHHSSRCISTSTARRNDSTDSLPPSKRLPQSPLLTHPLNKSQRPSKLRPDREYYKQAFDELNKNPWALALASPPRLCSITGARLPRDLLGEWGLVKEPETEQLYLLPVGLLKDSLDNDPQSRPASSSSTRQLVLRILDFMPLLKALGGPWVKVGRGKKLVLPRILPYRWRHPQGPITSREENLMAWRDDAAEFTLHHMRREVVKSLDKACNKFKRLDGPGAVWRVLELRDLSNIALQEALGPLEPVHRMACGAVLICSSQGAENETQESFMGSVSLPQTQSRVPVFDLSVLLSETELQTLRDSHPHFHHAALFFRPRDEVSNQALLSLWKIKRFLAVEDEPDSLAEA